MKAPVFSTEQGGLSLQERPSPPAPPPLYVKLRVAFVGICGTDFHILNGRHPHAQEPVILGHEISGTIVAVGECFRAEPGTAVVVNPYSSCGKCKLCNGLRSNCCEQLKVMGVHIDGGLCEEILVPFDRIYKLPGGLTLRAAAMIEILAVGHHAIGRSPLTHGNRVLVIGCGPAGLSIALPLRQRRYHVALMDKSSERVAMAKERFQLEPVFEADGSVADASKVNGPYDVVFDATGCAASASNAFNNLLAHGGALVSVGIMTADLQVDAAEGHRREKSLLFTRNSTHNDFREALRFAKENPDMVGNMVTTATTLDEAALNISGWASDNSGLLKGVVQIEPAAAQR